MVILGNGSWCAPAHPQLSVSSSSGGQARGAPLVFQGRQNLSKLQGSINWFAHQLVSYPGASQSSRKPLGSGRALEQTP